MNFHTGRSDFLKRVESRMDELISEFNGSVFRFVEPRFSSVSDMFAGKGSLFANGRWLLKDQHLATYTAATPETALGESLAANRYFGFPDEKLAPIVLVTAKAQLKRVINLCDGKVRQRLRIAEKTIVGCDWRLENDTGEEAITQAWGWAFAEAGAEGIIAPSAAVQAGRNLIIFPKNLSAKGQLTVTKKVKWPHS